MQAILCEKDAYMVELSAYFHLNPVRAWRVQRPRNINAQARPYLDRGKTGVVDQGMAKVERGV